MGRYISSQTLWNAQTFYHTLIPLTFPWCSKSKFKNVSKQWHRVKEELQGFLLWPHVKEKGFCSSWNSESCNTLILTLYKYMYWHCIYFYLIWTKMKSHVKVTFKILQYSSNTCLIFIIPVLDKNIFCFIKFLGCAQNVSWVCYSKKVLGTSQKCWLLITWSIQINSSIYQSRRFHPSLGWQIKNSCFYDLSKYIVNSNTNFLSLEKKIPGQ